MRDDVGLDQLIDISGPAFIARVSGTGKPSVVTPTQATALLDIFTPSLKGLTPPSGGGTVNFLRADNTWATPVTNLVDGDKGDITVTSSGAVWTIDANAITYSKLQNAATGLSIIGRSTNTSGVYAEITASSDGHVLRRLGTALGFGTLAAGAFATDTIGRSVLSNGVGLSVIGRSANSIGSVADISTTNGSGAVLREAAGVLGWGTVSTTGIGDSQVTYSKIQNVTTQKILGRYAASTGIAQEITIGSGLSLDSSTGILTASGGGGAGITDGDKGDITVSSSGTVWSVDNDAITFAKIQNINTSRLLGRYTAATGDIQEITLDSTIVLSSGGLLSVNQNYIIEDVPGTTYLFTQADNGKIKRFTSATGCTITIPTGLSLGWNALAYRASGAGLIIFTTSGTTVEGIGTTMPVEKTSVSITQRATNTFVLLGALFELEFGTARQVPFMNSGDTNFSYEAGFEYDSASNTLASPIINSTHSAGVNYGASQSGASDTTYSFQPTSLLGATGGTALDLIVKGATYGKFRFYNLNRTGEISFTYSTLGPRITHTAITANSASDNFIISGLGGDATFNSGHTIQLSAGSAYTFAGNGNGGNVTIQGGTANGSGTPGQVNIYSGTALHSITQGVIGSYTAKIQFADSSLVGMLEYTGANKTLTFTGTDAPNLLHTINVNSGSVTNVNGGSLQIKSGTAYSVSGNGNGGNILIQSGQKRVAGSGTDGNITLDSLTGYLIIANIPTSSAGLPSGAIWSNSGVLTRV